jgi:dihydropyrimidinase
MSIDTAVKNCKIVTPEGIIPAGIGIDDGEIVAIAADEYLPQAKKVINAKGNYVIPGLVDAHQHLDPRFGLDAATHIRNETASHALSGVTTAQSLLTATTNLVKEGRDYIDAWEKSAYIDLALTQFLITRENTTQIREVMEELGIIGFKIATCYKGDECLPGSPPADDSVLYLGMEEVAKLHKEGFNVHIRTHCEDVEIYFPIRDRYKEKGKLPRSYHEIRPSFIEESNMIKTIFYADLLGCPLYIVHITIKEGVDLIAKSRAEGKNVIGETCCQYLVLNIDNTDMVLSKVNPPIRTKEDNERLWEGIRDGTITVVGTDQSPRLKKEKRDLWSLSVGIPVVESFLPSMLSEGVNKGKLSLERLVEVCCYNPAKICGIAPEKGSIAIGSNADLVIIDLKKEAKVGERPVYGTSDFTAYAGFKFKGWPILTMLRGNIIMEDGKVIGKPGLGKYYRAKLKAQV